MIINIHGFTGHGANSKYDWLKANVPDQEIVAPDLDYVATPPEEILKTLSNLVGSAIATPTVQELFVLGSSLGGFFARLLNIIYPLVPTILINPTLCPFIPLRGLIDDKAYLALFARLTFQDDANPPQGLHVIVGKADDLIDHAHLTKPLLPPNLKTYYEIPGGVHRLVLTEEVGAILRSILFSKSG
ncbi:MAG: hypothetical protein LBI10_05060 [Deltaproteobacteria bacterium]|jgi:hypothetical protein|nr:hypothetical protein [Deltaproteobacteria bacterium]